MGGPCGDVEGKTRKPGEDSPCRSQWHAEAVVGELEIVLSWAEAHPEFSLLYHAPSLPGRGCSVHIRRAGAGSRWLPSPGPLSEQDSDDLRDWEHSNK